ncbi:MAG TPA: HAD-IA family hydrolase, partial [Candidatus Saccharimonadales bacterium]|nr:HAD-IA family hydrolase [Candidatus Saccharimonadales bacterium]
FVFDLDGTLIDSKMDLVNSVNAMLRETKRTELSPDLIASYVGHGAPQLMASTLGPCSTESDRKEALAIFLKHYNQQKLEETRPYPGVVKGLQLLSHSRVPMAVLTNKPTQLSMDILEGLHIARFFRFLYGGDSFPTKKPDPSGVLSVLRELGVPPEESAMVGDSDVDIQTARNAGMAAVGVTYGFGQHDRTRCPADVYVDTLVALSPLVRR